MKFLSRTAVGLLSLLCLSAQAANLGMNDVSILLPLPKNTSSDHLFSTATEGAHGKLFPQAVYDKLPFLAFDSKEETYAQLRVVAIRLDPCFPSLVPTLHCQAQVRLIWQPLQDREGTLNAIDAAAHSFYDLSDSDFAALIASLKALKAETEIATDSLPLSVHPVLLKEGVDGNFGKKLFGLIKGAVGQQRLSRVTFMQLGGAGNVWVFGGFEIAGDAINDMIIPRVNVKRQTFFNSPLRPTYFAHSGAVPEPQGADNFNLLMRESRKIVPSDEAEVIEGAMSAVRIENPTMHNPATIDCVSCHVAQPARLFADRQFPWLMTENRASPFRFFSNRDLTNTSPDPGNTRMVRAFGYDGTKPAISQRTINETASVLDILEKK